MQTVSESAFFGRIGAMGLAVALAFGLAACGEGQAEEAPRYATAMVERGDLQIVAEASGELEPLRRVDVLSKASGEVQETFVEVGDRVEPGTLLAQIDPRDVQNALNQAEADYEVARERYNVSRAQLDRSQRLYDSGVITEQDHESRTLDYANARANLVRAETTLELTQLQMEDVTIRSPMHGTVLSKAVEDGQVITSASGSASGGTTLLTIANLDVVQVRTLIDQTDVGRIEAGMPVNVRVEAFPDRTFEGMVEKIEPQATVQSNVTMFPVIVQLQNEDQRLKPGMSAEVTVVIAERPQTLTLPNMAIVAQREVAAAGSVLGLSEEEARVDQSAFQDLMRQVREDRGESGEAGAEGSEPPADMPDMAELRDKVASGEISQDSVRALMQAARGAGQSSARASGRDGSGAPSVVFVLDADGVVTPRPVIVGVNDWNNSEILAGLEEGEEVVLLGGAQLQEQQRQRQEQMRNRMGGGMPFGR